VRVRKLLQDGVVARLGASASLAANKIVQLILLGSTVSVNRIDLSESESVKVRAF